MHTFNTKTSRLPPSAERSKGERAEWDASWSLLRTPLLERLLRPPMSPLCCVRSSPICRSYMPVTTLTRNASIALRIGSVAPHAALSQALMLQNYKPCRPPDCEFQTRRHVFEEIERVSPAIGVSRRAPHGKTDMPNG